PNLVAMRRLAELLALRASAELAAGQATDSFDDLRVILCLSKGLGAEPYLVGTMVGCAMLGNMALQVFWEGLSSGKWNDDQMREALRVFGSTDLLANLDHALRGGERAGLDQLVQQETHLDELFDPGPKRSGVVPFFQHLYYRSWPKGWVYQNQV